LVLVSTKLKENLSFMVERARSILNYYIYLCIMMLKLQKYVESNAYGVCNKLSEKLRMPTSSVRLFFIYASFMTFGSPVIIYLALAFVMDFRKILRRRNNTLWYY